MSLPINCVSMYLEKIEQLQKIYCPSRIPTISSFLFRGICDEQYKLLPSIFRNNSYLSKCSEEEILCEFINEAGCYIDIDDNDFTTWNEYAQHYGVPTRFLDFSDNPLTALYFSCKNELDKNGAVWLIN